MRYTRSPFVCLNSTWAGTRMMVSQRGSHPKTTFIGSSTTALGPLSSDIHGMLTMITTRAASPMELASGLRVEYLAASFSSTAGARKDSLMRFGYTPTTRT